MGRGRAPERKRGGPEEAARSLGERAEGRRGLEQATGQQAPRAAHQLRKVLQSGVSPGPTLRRNPKSLRAGREIVGALSVRIGARSSRLSQAQTATVSDLIRKRFGEGLALVLVPVKTRGDRLPPEA